MTQVARMKLSSPRAAAFYSPATSRATPVRPSFSNKLLFVYVALAMDIGAVHWASRGGQARTANALAFHLLGELYVVYTCAYTELKYGKVGKKEMSLQVSAVYVSASVPPMFEAPHTQLSHACRIHTQYRVTYACTPSFVCHHPLSLWFMCLSLGLIATSALCSWHSACAASRW